MAVSAPSAAVLVDRPEVTLLDTRELPWEPHVGITGAQMKVLSRFDDDVPSVILQWFPPGFRAEKPSRHYHSTVHEWQYVISGTLPMREYMSEDDVHGRPVLFREGYFMDRRPGSIHGIDPNATSEIGLLGLEWRTGLGTYMSEPTAATENVKLSAEATDVDSTPLKPEGSPDWVVVDSGGLRLLDTWKMPWAHHEGMQRTKVRTLACDDEGGWDSINLLWMGPRDTGGEPERHRHRTVHEHGFVVAGDLPMREYASTEDEVGERVLFSQGVYMDRRPGAWHGVDTTRSSSIGFTFLEWRDGPGTYLQEPGMEKETEVLPAAQIDP